MTVHFWCRHSWSKLDFCCYIQKGFPLFPALNRFLYENTSGRKANTHQIYSFAIHTIVMVLPYLNIFMGLKVYQETVLKQPHQFKHSACSVKFSDQSISWRTEQSSTHGPMWLVEICQSAACSCCGEIIKHRRNVFWVCRFIVLFPLTHFWAINK